MNVFLVSIIVLLWVFVLGNLVLSLALVRRINELSGSGGAISNEHPDMLPTGTSAPPFQIERLDGNAVTEADFDEKPRTMVFVSPGCRPCEAILPTLPALYRKAQAVGRELMVICLADVMTTADWVGSLLEGDMPIYYAPRETNSIVDVYLAQATPSYYAVQADNRIEAAGIVSTPSWQAHVAPWSAH